MAREYGGTVVIRCCKGWLGFSCRRHVALVVSWALGACDVAAPPGTTGGVDWDDSDGACARGLGVIETDYASTNVSALALDGTVLSSRFIASSSESAGLTAALGGDVVLPTMPPLEPQMVLIDRLPGGVLTWVALRTGEVRAQLSVATGFSANPHDYLEVSSKKAYVTRFGHNFDAGREPFDGGSDVLVVDPSKPEIIGRIDLRPYVTEAGFLPRPDRLARVGDRVVVLLVAYDESFTHSAESRLALIDVESDAVIASHTLSGLHGCGALALGPDGTTLAVACAGEFGGDSVPDTSSSGIALVRTEPSLSTLKTISAEQLGGDPVGYGISFASQEVLLVDTFGRFDGPDGPARPDQLMSVELESGETEVLLESKATPFSLGDIACASACGVCFAADASREGGVVHRFGVEDGRIVRDQAIVVEKAVGLPPRRLGWL
jgi:hypothetical protein